MVALATKNAAHFLLCVYKSKGDTAKSHLEIGRVNVPLGKGVCYSGSVTLYSVVPPVTV
jgi:hypothetical protein